jgi:hypothetical protein
MSTLVRCPELIVLSTGKLMMFVHTCCLTAQGLNGDPVYLLDEFIEAFSPQEARRLIQRLEVVHTPKHGSWLNMAEIELNVLTRQCLARRVPDKQTLTNETAAWEKERNGQQAKIDWQFKTDDARTKLKHLYPKNQS